MTTSPLSEPYYCSLRAPARPTLRGLLGSWVCPLHDIGLQWPPEGSQVSFPLMGCEYTLTTTSVKMIVHLMDEYCGCLLASLLLSSWRVVPAWTLTTGQFPKRWLGRVSPVSKQEAGRSCLLWSPVLPLSCWAVSEATMLTAGPGSCH